MEKAFVKQEGITEEDMATAEDMGDYLLRTGKIEAEEYREKQTEAKMIINGKSNTENEEERVIAVKESAESKKYSVLMSLYKKEKPEYLRLALNSMLNQTVVPDEIVLVEDGPLTEELYAVLDEYPMLHRVKNETNLGLGLALNVGLKECRNELVARMTVLNQSVVKNNLRGLLKNRIWQLLDRILLNLSVMYLTSFHRELCLLRQKRYINLLKGVLHSTIQQSCTVKLRYLQMEDMPI